MPHTLFSQKSLSSTFESGVYPAKPQHLYTVLYTLQQYENIKKNKFTFSIPVGNSTYILYSINTKKVQLSYNTKLYVHYEVSFQNFIQEIRIDISFNFYAVSTLLVL